MATADRFITPGSKQEASRSGPWYGSTLRVEREIFSVHAELEPRHWWFRARRSIVRQLIERLVPPHTGALVADAGCGTGGTLGELADAYRCVGIDPTAEAIILAKQHFPGINFRTGLAPEGLRDVIADVKLVTMLDVLEHVQDDVGLLGAMVRALRPGAFLLLTVPADMRLWSPSDVAYGHHRRYDRLGFERIWAQLPVRPRLVSYFNSRLYPLVRTARLASRLSGRTTGHAGTDLAMPPGPANFALEKIFRGEAGVLCDTLTGKRKHGFTFGVSLIAVLEVLPPPS
jgi:SAM-dependent methyltransferase